MIRRAPGEVALRRRAGRLGSSDLARADHVTLGTSRNAVGGITTRLPTPPPRCQDLPDRWREGDASHSHAVLPDTRCRRS